MIKKILLITFSLLLALAIYPKQALAYIDPGSGSYMLQILFASMIGIFFSLKTIIKRVREFIDKLKKK